MKKVFGLFTGVMLFTTYASAQYVTEEPYIVYQEPYIARSYGKANWSYATAPQQYQHSGYTNAYAQARYGQTVTQDDAYFWNNSIVAKRFYATLRAGMGGTYGWDENEKTGKVEISVEKIDDEIILKFVDTGFAYNPLTKPDPDITLPPEKRQIGGLGIFMVKQSAKNVHYERNVNKNVLTMTFNCN